MEGRKVGVWNTNAGVAVHIGAESSSAERKTESVDSSAGRL